MKKAARHLKHPFKLCIAAAIVALTPSAALANDEAMSYTVKAGDTLYGLSEAYLRSSEAGRRLSKINNIRNPRRLPIGRTLSIPRSLLRYEAVEFTVSSLTGAVEIDGARPKVGARLNESDRIVTGAASFIAFGAANGGRISIPSNSNLQLVTARRYILGDTLDVDFKVTKGRSVIRAPKLKGQERYRLRTPNAVTAVRGTVFRVAHDAEAGVSASEVVEGTVAVSGEMSSNIANEGFGLTATERGVGDVEKLLLPPTMVSPGRIQTDEALEFVITPSPMAKGYRTQLARDVGFEEVLAEVESNGGTVTFEGLPNGRYAVRSRAISETGLEGLSEAYSFRRKRVGVSAGTVPSALEDAFKFKWQGAGEGATTYAFQIWQEGAEASPLVDEIGMRETEIAITGLEPAVYFWRVAAQQLDAEGLVKVWSSNQKLTISE